MLLYLPPMSLNHHCGVPHFLGHLIVEDAMSKETHGMKPQAEERQKLAPEQAEAARSDRSFPRSRQPGGVAWLRWCGGARRCR